MAGAGRVVIAGGTGFVGGEVVRTFERLGYETWVVSRQGRTNTAKTPSLLFSNKNENIKNLTTWDNIQSAGLPSRTVAVINCCGQNVLDPLHRWSEDFKQKVYNSRVKTNEMLARAIRESEDPPAAFIHMSGVGFYPPDRLAEAGSRGQTEASPGGQHDWLASLVKDWEAAAQLPTSSSTRVVSLRSGVVLGRKGGMIQQTLLPFFFGLGGRIGPGDQVMPWVHVKDVAGLMVHAVTSPMSGVYNTVSPSRVTNAEFTAAYARALSRPAIFPVPGFVMQTIFGAERAAMVLESQTVIPERTLDSGYNYRFGDIKEACEEFAHLDYHDQDEPGL